MQQIAIFASGAGSNAREIIRHFRNHSTVRISLIVCNKPGAGVLQIAADEKIPTLMLEKENFFRGDAYVSAIQAAGVTSLYWQGFFGRSPTC